MMSIYCASNKMKFTNSDEKDRQLIMKSIPIGSSLDYASKIMNENGFECNYIENGEFLNRSHINYLYCDRYETINLLITRRRQIAIILSNYKVSEIMIATGLLGP